VHEGKSTRAYQVSFPDLAARQCWVLRDYQGAPPLSPNAVTISSQLARRFRTGDEQLETNASGLVPINALVLSGLANFRVISNPETVQKRG
jgi:hypothetical protein